jgi:hypothetical protein
MHLLTKSAERQILGSVITEMKAKYLNLKLRNIQTLPIYLSVCLYQIEFSMLPIAEIAGAHADNSS